MTDAPARRRTGWIAAGAGAVALVSLVAVAASADRGSIDRARRSLVRADAAMSSGALDEAAAQLRSAGTEARPLLDGAWPLHAWSRVARASEVAALRAELDAAVGTLASAIEARAGRLDGLRRLRALVDAAATIAELDDLEAGRAGLGPLAATDAPDQHRELVLAIAARRARFEDDLSRNRRAIADASGRLDRAGDDPRALLGVIDSVLPRPERAGEAAALGELRDRAAAHRSAILGDRRIREAEGRAALAPSVREARAALEAIERDPDLARSADPALSRRIAEARASILRRIEALSAWESSQAAVDRAIDAGEPGAAALALARLAPCDDRSRSVAHAILSGFPKRAMDAFTRGAIAAADRGDLDSLQRLADAMRPGATAWQSLGANERKAAADSVAAVDARIDRALYDEFLRSPCEPLAARYLEGWPVRPRRMAPFVAAWREQAASAPIRIALEAARWRGLGLPSSSRTLEDRPDADIELRGPDGTVAADVARDIREDGSSQLGGAALVIRPDGDAPLRVQAAVRIDLRDAVAADPVAKGVEERSMSGWRSARLAELPVRDPLWGERPHLLLLRVTSPGMVALPPCARH